MREVCLLIGAGDVVLWSDASDNPVRLPDSRARWEAIWSRRDALVEIAHSHPVGPRAFSAEDESTMTALGTALARPLRFSVVAPDGTIRRIYTPGDDGFEVSADVIVELEPWWVSLLRLASEMKPGAHIAPAHQPRTPQEV